MRSVTSSDRRGQSSGSSALKGRAVSEVRKKANLRRLPPTFIAM